MGESYVRPVTGASEPKPEWVAVWRFRVIALVLLVAIGAGTAWGVNKLLHVASNQDPTSGDVQAPTESPAP